MIFKVLPLAVFLALAGFLFKGLSLDPSALPSPLIDQPAPQFSVATLPEGSGEFSNERLQGQVWLLNVWASWCTACVQEHPLLVNLADKRDIPLVGLNYKDTPAEADTWLRRFGNPYAFVLDDREGSVGLDWGVYGVPETFVIGRDGRVRYKHIGPLNADDISNTLLPVIDELLAVNS